LCPSEQTQNQLLSKLLLSPRQSNPKAKRAARTKRVDHCQSLKRLSSQNLRLLRLNVTDTQWNAILETPRSSETNETRETKRISSLSVTDTVTELRTAQMLLTRCLLALNTAVVCRKVMGRW